MDFQTDNANYIKTLPFVADGITLKEDNDVENIFHEITRALSEFINRDLLGVVVIFGIFGNFLSIIVFSRLWGKDRRTTTYLLPLAVADLGALFYGLWSWIRTGLDGHSDGYYYMISENQFSVEAMAACKLIRYFNRSLTCISSYIIVAYTLERCIGVWFPLKVRVLVTTTRRHFIITIIMVSMFILNIPVLIYYDVFTWSKFDGPVCFFHDSNMADFEMFFLVEILDVLLPYSLPWLVISVGSVLIIIRVWQSRGVIRGKNRAEAQGLFSLLLIALLYLVTTLPYSVIWGLSSNFVYLRVEYFFLVTEMDYEDFLNLGLSATSISFVNHSSNFVIYACTLKIFKFELRKMFCGIGRQS
jgi:hypothetical protein